MKKRVWLSFDLGLDGAYDDLNVWLDKVGAVECGDTLCSFELDIGKKEPGAAVLTELRKHGVTLRPKDRLYLIWRGDRALMKGAFIHGKRRKAPWTGCFVDGVEESEDAA